MIERPKPDEMHPYYQPYVDGVTEPDLFAVLAQLRTDTSAVCEGLGPEQLRFRYAPGKWSILELLGHLTDAERVFGSRALAFARGDGAEQPGFDENEYVAAGRFDERSIDGLLAELNALREANLQLFTSLDPEAHLRRGVANRSEMSVRAVAWVLAGHHRHHLAVLRERYLSALEA